MNKLVGKAVRRKEGNDKVRGSARYVDDLTMPGMLHGATVRSSGPRGRIVAVHFDPSVDWSTFVVVQAKDIPGKNVVALLTEDQPFLAHELVSHPEEPVVLLAHADKHELERGRRAVRVELSPLPAVFNLDASLAKEAIVWGEDNVLKSYRVEKGDVETALAQADHVVEGEYRTGAQEQLYIENNGVIAVANPTDGVTVWGSLQCPYYVHKALLPLFALPADKVRVVQTETGGGFGGKEEYPSILAGHAALLAWKSGKPVKLIYDRAEDMVATTKRHPSRTRHRTGVMNDGRIVAMDIEFVLDGGAYNTLSPVVLSRGTIHAAGPYAVPNVRIQSKAVATSCPPHGAFRGFGAPQSIFAVERHLEKVARAVGLPSDELRRRNFLVPGATTATGQVIREPVDLAGLMERAFTLSDYRTKRERFERENAGRAVKKGIGFAAFMHGSGFTGSGERYLKSLAGVEATTDGKVRVLAASTEIGQGANTIFAQIAAETLGLTLDDVEVAQPDTAHVPNSGPTVASRTTMVVGNLIARACRGLALTLVQGGALAAEHTPDELRRACADYVRTRGALRVLAEYEEPKGIHWDDKAYRGDAYGTYAWAVYVAEVSVDCVTYQARVDDFVAVQEVGKVIHPVLAAGQIEGGVAQGIGWALYEDVVWREGRMHNGQMTNYIMPTAADVPPIRVFFAEEPYAHGPYGAKGIGELPMDGPAPAVLNAVEHAVGLPADQVPLLPEALLRLMRGAA